MRRIKVFGLMVMFFFVSSPFMVPKVAEGANRAQTGKYTGLEKKKGFTGLERRGAKGFKRGAVALWTGKRWVASQWIAKRSGRGNFNFVAVQWPFRKKGKGASRNPGQNFSPKGFSREGWDKKGTWAMWTGKGFKVMNVGRGAKGVRKGSMVMLNTEPIP